MASENVRQLAREHPEAFRRVANMRDDCIQDHMLEVLQEETQAKQADESQATLA